MDIPNPVHRLGPLAPPPRLLCGPGPGNAHPRVHAAMSLPQLGHMDPLFLRICEDVKELLRYTWQTKELFTIPVSGTGSAAWEAAIANVTRPGDVHLVCVNGYFGERHCDMASRYGATVHRIDKSWGGVFSYDEIAEALLQYKPQFLWVCYAETSTGAKQPLEGIGPLCHQLDCLFMLDTVTAIGGIPLFLDELEVDICYAGTQKCLSCPPGIAPLMLNQRALSIIKKRNEMGEKIPNWYLDMTMISKYIEQREGAPRVYHHTAPISMIFALREALTIIAEEGLENVWIRHQATAEYFWSLIESVGLEMLISNKEFRLPSLHTVKVPLGVDAAKAIQYMREKFDIEIGGGLGSLAGKVFRIGLMGYNSRSYVALSVFSALVEALKQQKWKPSVSS
uniref:alanine--glyoxylate transaminase n=1 Tax=Cardiosporidium cionae TaxID=476202 RepID=A0A3S8V2R1_9APIC|nr:serine-pyruvate transaminase [Cardiosporidium cionae]